MSRHQLRIALVLFTALTASACGDKATGPGPNQATENTLVFTRADGSTVAFAPGSQLRAWCGPWDGTTVTTPAVHVQFRGTGQTDRGWLLTAVRTDAKIGVPLAFPNEFSFSQPKNADLFVLDTPNELSSSRPGSSGSITFQQLDCSAGGRVEFTIAATVGSEFSGGPAVSVTGRVNAPIGAAPQ